MTDPVAQDQLQSFVRRIEALEDEIGALNGDKSEVYKEAKGNGFDVKVLRKVIADRRKDASERNEFDEVYQLYWDAIHGVVRAHVENIEQFGNSSINSSIPEHDADGVIIEPQPEPSEALRQIEAGPVAKAGDPSEAAMLPQTGAIETLVANSEPLVFDPADAPSGAATRKDAGTAAPNPITDLTQPNPICRDPSDCGVYASWHHPCLACKRAASVRAAA